ncbi:MAG TPA: anthrone oxygenase family protein [Streptosporangiaceae bacterium]|jgi:uncharacterized membrane protein
MESLRVAALIAATMSVGLMAGVFGVYANSIMPGLRRTDDRTFVGAFQSMDKAIINPLFMVIFLGALVLTGLAAVLHAGTGSRSVLPWAAAAFVLYLAAVVITIAVNVPLNDALKAAGPPDRIADLAAARQRFNERKWAAWNVARTLSSTAAFGCLAWALVASGELS